MQFKKKKKKEGNYNSIKKFKLINNVPWARLRVLLFYSAGTPSQPDKPVSL